jgi:2-polyprenyl-6-methoxyphenol hydroxylase-like FAD-dependent oxidoreductase
VFGKKLVGYQTLVEGGVRACFDDGTSVDGMALVGADGVRSNMRKQSMPDAVLLDTEIRAVFGKTHLDGKGNVGQELAKWSECGIKAVFDDATGARRMLFMDTMRFGPQANLPLNLPQDYLYWVLCFHADDAALPKDKHLLKLSNTESAELAKTLTKDWHPSTQAPIFKQDTAETSTLAMCMIHPDSLRKWTEHISITRSTEPVTLLGDAAHPMPPLGGVGANSAFQDVAALCSVLTIALSTDVGSLAAKLRVYEESVAKRAGEALDMSAMGAGRLFGMKRIDELNEEKIWESGGRS